MKTPKGWRKGQTIFNFLEWLHTQGFEQNESHRMIDPFHIPDEDWDELYEQFLIDNN